MLVLYNEHGWPGAGALGRSLLLLFLVHKVGITD